MITVKIINVNEENVPAAMVRLRAPNRLLLSAWIAIAGFEAWNVWKSIAKQNSSHKTEKRGRQCIYLCIIIQRIMHIISIFSKIQSVCERVKRCKDCRQLIRSRRNPGKHKCGFFDCPTCKDYVKRDGHQCYIQHINDEKLEKKMAKTLPVFIYYDFETRQDLE